MSNSSIVSPSAATRMTRLRPVFAIFSVLLVAFFLFSLLPAFSSSAMPYSITNPRPQGAQALARVLKQQGFTVEETSVASEAFSLMRKNENSDPTLVILDANQVNSALNDSLAQLPRIVAFNASWIEPASFLPGVSTSYSEISSGSVDAGDTTSTSARAAGTVSAFNTDALMITDGDWHTAFPVPSTDVDVDLFLYAEKRTDSTYRAVFTTAALMQNSRVNLHGNSALAINMLTAASDIPPAQRGPIIFWRPKITDDMSKKAMPVPPWAAPMCIMGLLALITVGLSKGVRLGRLVFEDTPSYVPAIETVTGKGRLLHQQRQVAHSAMLLRQHTADKLSRRLAVPHSAPPEALRTALLAAGASADNISWLWEPTPVTSADLQTVSDHLTALEKEILS